MEQISGIDELRATLREVDRSRYPGVSGYTKAENWREMGPGGLYLVSLLAASLDLRPNALVLDLGCGSAASSLYLADNYGARVIAVDLWTDPADNARRIESRGHRGDIIPLQLDAGQPLPFADGYFDAILCVNNLNSYGTDLAVLDRIARHLKRGGVFCSGGECLNEEFTPEQLVHPPAVYSFDASVWKDDFLTSHSPAWWADHVARSDELQLVSCRELEDGPRLFEGQALLTEPEGYIGLSARQARELEIRQIAFGRENRPYMTLYHLVARRR